MSASDFLFCIENGKIEVGMIGLRLVYEVYDEGFLQGFACCRHTP